MVANQRVVVIQRHVPARWQVAAQGFAIKVGWLIQPTIADCGAVALGAGAGDVAQRRHRNVADLKRPRAQRSQQAGVGIIAPQGPAPVRRQPVIAGADVGCALHPQHVGGQVGSVRSAGLPYAVAYAHVSTDALVDERCADELIRHGHKGVAGVQHPRLRPDQVSGFTLALETCLQWKRLTRRHTQAHGRQTDLKVDGQPARQQFRGNVDVVVNHPDLTRLEGGFAPVGVDSGVRYVQGKGAVLRKYITGGAARTGVHTDVEREQLRQFAQRQ